LRFSARFLVIAETLPVGLVAVGAAAVIQAPAAPTPADPGAIRAQAARAASMYVASRPAVLQPSTDDGYIQHAVISSAGVQYVPYDRTYKGLPVIGGDFVVVTDPAGRVRYTSVAQSQPIGRLPVTTGLTGSRAAAVARGQLAKASAVEGTHLVVFALGPPRLAWESTVDGTGAAGLSRLSVDVDAATGVVLRRQEHVLRGTGTGGWNGPNPVHLDTTKSGTGFAMTSPVITNLSCQDYATHSTFESDDDLWGDGDPGDEETGCVDALFAAQTEIKMLHTWLGRDGIDGTGGAWPIRIGLNDQNAFYDGTQVAVGYNMDGQYVGSLDVIGHELGHGVDDHTPGGISGSGTQEFVADTFGTATEWFANEPAPFDTPDFTIGETVDMVGDGPLRYMYDPSVVWDDNCYSDSIPGEEVHTAAGPGDHWFYLLSEGSDPVDGQPASPTCDGSTLAGLGVRSAMRIMYNAMLMKTSGASYLKYRVWTLQAAKNLFPVTCAEFDAVRAAWNAVSVPEQPGEPTCSGRSPVPSPTARPSPTGGHCSGQVLKNPGFESGPIDWSGTTGVIGRHGPAGEAPHSGAWNAWLDGYGQTHVDTLSQRVAVPARCHATLTFWIHIDTAETARSRAYDTLVVQYGDSTLVTLSNLDHNTGYTQLSFDLSAFAGRTVELGFTGFEDSSLHTSFVVDDTAVTLR
jgi:Zn-dependent metalloprotease